MCERLITMMELVGEIGRLEYLKTKIKEKISRKNNSKNINDELLEIYCIAREFALYSSNQEYKRKVYEELQIFIYTDLNSLNEVSSSDDLETFIKNILSLFSVSVENKKNDPLFIQQLVIDRFKVSIKNAMTAIKERTMDKDDAISAMFRVVEKYVLLSAKNFFENKNNLEIAESLTDYKEELIVLLINQKLNTNIFIKNFFNGLLDRFVSIVEHGNCDALNCLRIENDSINSGCSTVAICTS